jgi:hypothetical protein
MRTTIDVKLSRNELHYIVLSLHEGLRECERIHPEGLGSHGIYKRLIGKFSKTKREYEKRLKKNRGE